MIVRVVPYDSHWPASYAAEAERICKAVGEVAVRIHHIGSTSVPGLSAKPIIDILLEVSDLAALDACSPTIEALGYEAMGELGIPGRRYFRRDNDFGERTHQIHAFAVSSEEIHRHLAFRDYLIAHPEIARAYGELKQELALRFPTDIDGYMDGKDSFVKRHEAEALARSQKPMTLHPVETEDLQSIRALIAAAVRKSVAQSEEEAAFLINDIEESLSWWQNNRDVSLHLKCVDSGSIVGVVLVKEFWNLTNLFVAPDYRGRGVGRRLVEEVLEVCRTKSPRAAVLVNSSSTARGFYEHMQFVQTGPAKDRPGGCIPFRYDF